MVVALEFNGGMLVTGYDKVTGIAEVPPADDMQLDGAWLDADQRTPREPNALQKAIQAAVASRDGGSAR